LKSSLYIEKNTPFTITDESNPWQSIRNSASDVVKFKAICIRIPDIAWAQLELHHVTRFKLLKTYDGHFIPNNFKGNRSDVNNFTVENVAFNIGEMKYSFQLLGIPLT